MRAIAAVLAAVVLLSAHVNASDDPTLSLPGVIDLDPSNYDTYMNGKKAALVEFYAPWCGHCKRLVPEYTKLGEKIANDPKLRNRVLIAKVNADEHKSIGSKFEVRGFPTIKWFPRGKPNNPEEYNSGRSLDDFLKFINQKLEADAGFAQVEELIPFARSFMNAEASERADIVTEAEKAVNAVEDEHSENAKLYVRYMKKALEKGTDYIAKELERLTSLMEKPMSATKLDQMSRKVSVLQSFSEDSGAAAADDVDDLDWTDEDEADVSGGAAAADDDDADEDDGDDVVAVEADGDDWMDEDEDE